MADGFLDRPQVDTYIGQLQAAGRPNFHGVTAADIVANPLVSR